MLTAAQTAAAIRALHDTIARCGDRDDRRGEHGWEDGERDLTVTERESAWLENREEQRDERAFWKGWA